MAALYETLRDYSDFVQAAKAGPDPAGVEKFDEQTSMGDAAAPGSTANGDNAAGKSVDPVAGEGPEDGAHVGC
jgi:hypothetical protein